MENINDKDTEEKLEETFKALSNPNRLKIVYILSNKEDKTVTVTEIAKKMNISQPAASQHLKILKTAHIVQCNKKGNNIYYKINIETVCEHKECIDSLFHIILE